MSRKLAFRLMWIPGLFWLYPIVFFSHEDYDDIDRAATKYSLIHGLYGGIQISIIVLALLW